MLGLTLAGGWSESSRSLDRSRRPLHSPSTRLRLPLLARLKARRARRGQPVAEDHEEGLPVEAGNRGTDSTIVRRL